MCGNDEDDPIDDLLRICTTIVVVALMAVCVLFTLGTLYLIYDLPSV